jgi:hypothetical protein
MHVLVCAMIGGRMLASKGVEVPTNWGDNLIYHGQGHERAKTHARFFSFSISSQDEDFFIPCLQLGRSIIHRYETGEFVQCVSCNNGCEE